MNFIDPKIEEYSIEKTTAESELLRRLSRETHLKTYMPRMLSGHLQGRLLSMISKMCNPSLIVEVGTFTGYSALCLAEGLPAEGKLITIDINEELKPLVQPFFEGSIHGKKIEMRYGNALTILKEIKDPIDLAFIDADKENYPAYWEIIFPKMKSGGIIIADNMLWSGKVIDENEKDIETEGVRKFAAIALNEKKAEQVLLPVRDGLLIIRKK
ncbi:MAG: O-methyltransferase [Bacteroidetes bacterium]|nr:O-methyltransferase [Bacteroidota bacterium]